MATTRAAVTTVLVLVLAACGATGSPAASEPASSADASGAPSSSATATASIPTPQPSPPASAGSPGVAVGSWSALAPMAAPRAYHAATLLSDGRVLVAGGLSQGAIVASAEIYDPAGGTWSAAGEMTQPRAFASATLLLDGTVLVAGGVTSLAGDLLSTSELYDPASGTWTRGADMAGPRARQVDVRLDDGRVLLVGGVGTSQGHALATAELYDPKTGRWTPTGSMADARDHFDATLLPDGTVLAAGGLDEKDVSSAPAPHVLDTAELYDPKAGTWTPTTPLPGPVSDQTGTLMRDGTVLVAAGTTVSTLVYEPDGATWRTVRVFMTTRHPSGQTTTLLPDGRVLLVAGSAEVFDPASGTWATTAGMVEQHGCRSATQLTDGRVLVAGGSGPSALCGAESAASVEIFDPSPGRCCGLGLRRRPAFECSQAIGARMRILGPSEGGAGAPGPHQRGVPTRSPRPSRRANGESDPPSPGTDVPKEVSCR
jgi:hypothetical protein